MNNSNYINISRLFQQIPPLMFTDVDVHPMMKGNQPGHFLTDCPKSVLDERIKYWFLKASGL